MDSVAVVRLVDQPYWWVMVEDDHGYPDDGSCGQGEEDVIGSQVFEVHWEAPNDHYYLGV